MALVDDFKKKVANNPETMSLTTNPDGSTKVTLGLGDRRVSPISVDFDKAGNAVQVQFPNQSRSGSTYVTPNSSLMGALVENAGREGGDFIARVNNKLTGSNYNANHFDPAQSL